MSATGVSKIGRFPAPASFESATSSQGRLWELGWNAVNIVSFESVDPRKSRTSGNYKTALGHSCGCVPLFRCARLSLDGSSCGQCEVCSIKHPKDEHMLSFAYE